MSSKKDKSREISEELRQKQEQRYDYTKDDVLLGRDTTSFRHQGNVAFRSLIKLYSDRYNKAETRRHKFIIIDQIKRQIEGHGARFLRKDKETGRWEQEPEKGITQKISHALRDSFTKLRRNKHKTRPDDPRQTDPRAVGEQQTSLKRERQEPQSKLDALAQHSGYLLNERMGRATIRPSQRPSSPVNQSWVNFYARAYREVDMDESSPGQPPPTTTGQASVYAADQMQQLLLQHDDEVRRARSRAAKERSLKRQSEVLDDKSLLSTPDTPQSRPRKRKPKDLSSLTSGEEGEQSARQQPSITKEKAPELSPPLSSATLPSPHRPRPRKPKDLSCVVEISDTVPRIRGNAPAFASLPPYTVSSGPSRAGQRSLAPRGRVYVPEGPVSALAQQQQQLRTSDPRLLVQSLQYQGARPQDGSPFTTTSPYQSQKSHRCIYIPNVYPRPNPYDDDDDIEATEIDN